MNTVRGALVFAALSLLLACSASAQTTTFDFDTGTPTLFAGTTLGYGLPPLTQTSSGLTASFSSPDLRAFSVQTQNSTGFFLSQFFGNYLYPNTLNRNRLDVQFSQPITRITLTFATTDFHDPNAGNGSNILLTAYQGSTTGTLVGSATAYGTFLTGDTFPQGTLTFDSGGIPFDAVRLVVPYQPQGASEFLVDNITVTPAITVALSSLTLTPTTVAGSLNVTGKVTLNGLAPPGGTVVALSSANPAAGVPASVTVPAGLTSATFVITTTAVTASTAGNITATYAGVSRSVKLTVRPISVKVLTLTPTITAGGNTVAGKVTLEAAAAPGNITVALSSSNAVASLPASLTIPAGQSTGVFTISTTPVLVKTTATIKAAANGLYKTAILTVRLPGVKSVVLSPTSVLGGLPSTATVTLDGPATGSGTLVTLASSRLTAATVPASITIPTGITVGTFPVTTLPVSANTSAIIKATANGIYKTATLSVKAPGVASLTLNPVLVKGGTPSTGTVTLTGPAGPTGAIVTLSSSNTLAATVPTSIVVAPGQTVGSFSITSKPVTTNKLVTIKATTNAIYKTAVLTVTP